MTGYAGRRVEFTWKGVEILGVREKGITANGEAIDITSDDDDGWRALLSEAGQRQIDLAINGVIKSSILRRDWFLGDAARVGAVTIQYPDGSEISGTFVLVNYNEGNPYKDASTFEAQLQSTGEVIYSPYE